MEALVTECDALLRAVLLSPADDLPRLVFADWLEEHDQPERAAFIRVQCELAADATPREMGCDWGVGRPCHRHRLCKLRRRELDLLRGSLGLWERGPDMPQPADFVDPKRFAEHSPSPTSRTPIVGRLFTRGFVSGIRLPLAALPEHAAAIFAAHPVTEVQLTNAAPIPIARPGPRSRANWVQVDPDLAEWFSFYRQYAGGVPHTAYLPAGLFDRLEGWQQENPGTFGRYAYRFYPTATAAHAALSTACVAYGRQIAELASPEGGEHRG